MKIKNLETKTNIFLAPMAGYTDVAFREQCKKYGAGLTTTEMVSAKGHLKTSSQCKFLDTNQMSLPKLAVMNC